MIALPPPTAWRDAATPGISRACDDLSILINNNALAVGTDGYPLRQMAGTWVVHPMDGRYVLDALCDFGATAFDSGLRDAIAHVSRAVRARLTPLGDARVFWYEADSLPTGRLKSRRHISALTQATYARSLARAGRLVGDESLAATARACFEALLIPDPPGVLQEVDGEVYLAEVPMRPRDFVLNAWLTTLEATTDYGRLTGDTRADDIVGRSARFLRRVLPLYDVPELANSRYSLTGNVKARLEFEPRARNLDVADVTTVIPGEGLFPVETGTGDPWRQQVDPRYAEPTTTGFRVRAGVLLLNLVLSRVGFPEPPAVRLRVLGSGVERVHLKLFLGRYSPLTNTPVELEWRTLSTAEVGHDGQVDLRMPWDDLRLIGYPTNFGKRVGPHLVNSFHPINIDRLRAFGARTGADEFDAWADRWEEAMHRWPEMELYAGKSVLIGQDVVSVESLGSGGSGKQPRSDEHDPGGDRSETASPT